MNGLPPVTEQNTLLAEKKLGHIKATLINLIHKYQTLEKDFMMSKFSLDNTESQFEVNKFNIAVEVIENKLKLCDLDLQVLEVQKKNNSKESSTTLKSVSAATDTRALATASREGENARRILDLEKRLKEATEELSKQRNIQRKMETSFKESKQKRVEHMRVLIEELRKYLSHVDALSKEVKMNVKGACLSRRSPTSSVDLTIRSAFCGVS